MDSGKKSSSIEVRIGTRILCKQKKCQEKVETVKPGRFYKNSRSVPIAKVARITAVERRRDHDENCN